MILPDAAIWIDRLRRSNDRLDALLDADKIAAHPFVTGEVSLGSIGQRRRVPARLEALPQLRVASPAQVATLVDAERLWSCDIGYVDAQLLASVRMAEVVSLWTRDKRLHAQAERLGVAFAP